MELLKAFLLGAGIVASMFHGPIIFRIIAMRYAFIIDVVFAVILLAIMAPAGAAATAFGGMMGVAITVILVGVRLKARVSVERDWTVNKWLMNTAIIAVLGWIPVMFYNEVWLLFWIAGIVLSIVALKPLKPEQIEDLENDPEVFYMRKSTWAKLLRGKKL